jgi:hypothetical protein
MFGSPRFVSGLTFDQRTRADKLKTEAQPLPRSRVRSLCRRGVDWRPAPVLRREIVHRCNRSRCSTVERSYLSRRRNFEDRAAAENQIAEMSEGAGTAHPRRSIEIPVAGPHQRGFRGISVGTVGLGTKAVERSQFAGRLDFENRTIAHAPAIAGGSIWRFQRRAVRHPGDIRHCCAANRDCAR